jgi:hypothetical protein
MWYVVCCIDVWLTPLPSLFCVCFPDFWNFKPSNKLPTSTANVQLQHPTSTWADFQLSTSTFNLNFNLNFNFNFNFNSPSVLRPLNNTWIPIQEGRGTFRSLYIDDEGVAFKLVFTSTLVSSYIFQVTWINIHEKQFQGSLSINSKESTCLWKRWFIYETHI